jgi:hypothetical protein
MRKPSDFSSFHRPGLMDRRTMLSGALAAGAVAVGGPVLWAGAADALAGSGDGAAQAQLFSWRRSLPVDSMSPGIGSFGGTELRALATMDGSLYAGNGYWRDSQQSNPALPGAQVYVLDAPTVAWKVDAEFSARVAPGGKRRYQAIGTSDRTTPPGSTAAPRLHNRRRPGQPGNGERGGRCRPVPLAVLQQAQISPFSRLLPSMRPSPLQASQPVPAL